MAQQTDENDKPLTYWGGLDFTNKNANNIKSDSTQLSGTILASESLGVDNLVNKQQTAVEWLHQIFKQREPDKFDWEQAKQMENEQTDKAYYDGVNDERKNTLRYKYFKYKKSIEEDYSDSDELGPKTPIH
jgi:uncharacterized membrane protein YfhO